MNLQQLSYAGPIRLDPVPALRRVRALAITWSALVILYEITTFVTTLFWPEGGGWSAYLEYPLWVKANALGAILVASAVFVWRRVDPSRTVWPVFVLASAALLIMLAVSIGRIATYQFAGAVNGALGLASESARFGAVAAIPLTIGWAMIQPQKFTAVRLAAVSGLTMVLAIVFTGASIASVGTSISPWSSSFWNTLLSRGWSFLVVQVACALSAAVLFCLATRSLRQGRSAATAVVASWLILAMIGWECLFVYGLWWDSLKLAPWLNGVRIAGVGLYLLWIFSAGLGFVLPLRRAAT